MSCPDATYGFSLRENKANALSVLSFLAPGQTYYAKDVAASDTYVNGTAYITGGTAPAGVTLKGYIEYYVDDSINNKQNQQSYTLNEAGGSILVKDPVCSKGVFGGWYYDEALTIPAFTGDSLVGTAEYASGVGDSRLDVSSGVVGATNYGAGLNHMRGMSYDEDSLVGNSETRVPTNFAEYTVLYAKLCGKITYNLDGGVNNSANPVKYELSSSITLKEPTKEGYKFDGWYASSKFSGNAVTKVDTSKLDVVLYAKWTKIETESKSDENSDGKSDGKSDGDSSGDSDSGSKPGSDPCKNGHTPTDSATAALSGNAPANGTGSLADINERLLKSAATCTEKAVYYQECSVCHAKLATTYEAGAALGHNESKTGKYKVSDATCSKKAVFHYECSTCHIELETTYEDGIFSEHTPAEKVIPAKVGKDGSVKSICQVCSEVVDAKTIKQPFVTMNETAKYTGKAIKQAVKVVDVGGKAIDKKYYKVTYKNNTKVGKATAIITFTGNYTGEVKKTFTIVKSSVIPKTVSGLKVTAGKKQISISWTASKSKISGYELQYSTNKYFLKSVKTVTMKTSATSKSVKKLSAKTTYYVRIRAYVKSGKNKVYSGWSGVKQGKTK